MMRDGRDDENKSKRRSHGRQCKIRRSQRKSAALDESVKIVDRAVERTLNKISEKALRGSEEEEVVRRRSQRKSAVLDESVKIVDRAVECTLNKIFEKASRRSQGESQEVLRRSQGNQGGGTSRTANSRTANSNAERSKETDDML